MLKHLVLAVFLALATTAALAATDDACSLVTSAQVSAAAGSKVGAGEYVTPTFKKTCTWHAKGIIVTLNLQDPGMFENGKAGASYGGKLTAVAGLGDAAYYLAMGPQVGLTVKKGGTSFKVDVYSKLPLEKLEAIEKAVAQDALAKL